jgi:hypothetical protein
MATKSKGVGRGGPRPGAGRKPKPKKAAALTDDELSMLLAGKTVEELMELAVRMSAAQGNWDEVSKAGKRLLDHRARPAAQGKKVQRQDAAATLAQASIFAPPAPPKLN